MNKKIITIIILIAAIIGIGLAIISKTNIMPSRGDEAPVGSEITGLTEEEQEAIYNENKSSNFDRGTWVIDEELGVYMPVENWNDSMNADDEAYVLEQNALTYPEYGSPGEGNFITFAHNSGYYTQGYFTPFVEGLAVGDIITVMDNGDKYEYKITDKKHIDVSETSEVYYKSPDKSIITIGTCDVPVSGATGRYIWTGELIEDNAESEK